MAKRVVRKTGRGFISMTGSIVGRDHQDAEEFHLDNEASRLFRDAKFDVRQTKGIRSEADLIVTHTEVGRRRRYAVEVVADLTSKRAQDYVKRFMKPISNPGKIDVFDEYWLITNRLVDRAIRENREHYHPRIRILDIGELKKLLAPYRPPGPSAPKARKGKTKIGKTVEANEKEIVLAVAGLVLQIDAKIETLRAERPNSDEAIAERDAHIAEYKRMRDELEHIQAMVVAFNKGTENEARVVKSVKTFAEGVRSWWDKGHDAILTKTFDMGLFTTAVGICSMAGAGGKMSVAVSAVLIGGKPVAQTLKGMIPKRIMGD